MNTPQFLVFSDALMAALASRSHEWSQWEIRECQENVSILRGEPTGRPPEHAERHSAYVILSVNVPGSRPGQMGHAALRLDPQNDSPSDAVSRALTQAVSAEMATFDFPDWREGHAARPAAEIEAAFLSDPRAWIEGLAAELSSAGEAWRIEGVARRFQIRNSRGFNATLTETELSVRVGTRTLASGARLDRVRLRALLSNR